MRVSMREVRTTVDLPDEIHRLASALARSRSQTLSQTIADILRRALAPEPGTTVDVDDETGLPTVRLGRPITNDDVAALEDEV